jgi:hypothetical protein
LQNGGLAPDSNYLQKQARGLFRQELLKYQQLSSVEEEAVRVVTAVAVNLTPAEAEAVLVGRDLE